MTDQLAYVLVYGLLATTIGVVVWYGFDVWTENKRGRSAWNSSTSPKRGQRVEVLLHRGEVDVWYAGTAEGGRVRLDTYPHGDSVVEPDEIADWRPIEP